MEARHPLSSWRFWIKIFASLAIAAGFGYWVHQQGISLLPSADQMQILWHNWWGPVGFILILSAVHFLRAYRWQYLLRPLSKTKVRLFTVLAVAFVGFFAIMVLPLRTGELVRPYLISKRGHVTMSAAFGTIAIERVVDGLILSGALTVCLLLLPLDQPSHQWAKYAGVLTLGIFVSAMIVLLLMLWMGEKVVNFLENVGKKIWARLSIKIANVLREFLKGLSALPNQSHLIPFVFMSLLYWGLNGIGMWMLARSCGLDIELVGGYTIMTMLGVGILIPTGPGHFGNFQAAVAAALGLLGLTALELEGAGSVYIFILYICMLGLTVGVGSLSLLSQNISLSKVIQPGSDIKEASHSSRPSH